MGLCEILARFARRIFSYQDLPVDKKGTWIWRRRGIWVTKLGLHARLDSVCDPNEFEAHIES